MESRGKSQEEKEKRKNLDEPTPDSNPSDQNPSTPPNPVENGDLSSDVKLPQNPASEKSPPNEIITQQPRKNSQEMQYKEHPPSHNSHTSSPPSSSSSSEPEAPSSPHPSPKKSLREWCSHELDSILQPLCKVAFCNHVDPDYYKEVCCFCL